MTIVFDCILKNIKEAQLVNQPKSLQFLNAKLIKIFFYFDLQFLLFYNQLEGIYDFIYLLLRVFKFSAIVFGKVSDSELLYRNLILDIHVQDHC